VDWIGYYFDYARFEAGLSDKRAAWAVRWCQDMASQELILMRELRAGLGRLGFAASVARFLKPFLAPLYAWISMLPEGSCVTPPLMVRLLLSWVSGKVGETPRIPMGLRAASGGERFRADAKAEGDLIVLGGWELYNGEDTRNARWFSVHLGREEIPWAYVRGDPFRFISALELLATLLCIVIFDPQLEQETTCGLRLTASTDNRGNGFALNKLASSKYPLYLVLMELSEQLESRGLILNLAWRPRDENEQADALTNGHYGAFNTARRLPVVWSKVKWLVLPGLLEAAEMLFKETQAKRAKPSAAGPSGPAGGASGHHRKQGKEETLRVRDPW